MVIEDRATRGTKAGGPQAKRSGGVSVANVRIFVYQLSVYYLPEEIIERIAAGMNLRYHLVEISSELVYADLVLC